jgi:hypothetical protein
VRAFHKRNHAVEKAVPLVHRHANDNPVAEHSRAAGDRAAIATALANDGGRLAGDRQASSTLAIPSITSPSAGNGVASLANDGVAFLEISRGNFVLTTVVQPTCHGGRAHPAQGRGLSFAPDLPPWLRQNWQRGPVNQSQIASWSTKPRRARGGGEDSYSR